ncbi:hypothetical protein IEQ34_025133 [Dendrobium chrysotoxum]|uniref:Uncharacterized protein n=1 Tax=Dendrobium chrysotoxum TaxID=161865 RepID=A0AAV7FRV9_DENCH|nr:hypothetical protein IEQ34_025133 [Dendrobium chrysotoxum]
MLTLYLHRIGHGRADRLQDRPEWQGGGQGDLGVAPLESALNTDAAVERGLCDERQRAGSVMTSNGSQRLTNY